MTQTSVRELIKGIRDEMRETPDLLPDRAAEMLKDLASLYGNCLDELRHRLMTYNRVKRIAFETELKANRAKILAETDESYEAWLEAKDTKDLCLELIRSLKYYLRNREEELRYSGLQ